ncbi:MAG: hypothetical protein AB7U05_15465 [Mangrovibacterium sp.]
MRVKIWSIIWISVLLFRANIAWGGDAMTDSVASGINDAELFYDSLKTKAYRHGLTRFVYQNIVNGVSSQQELTRQYEQLKRFQGKTIASVNLKPLDVFGPTFRDTTQVTHSKLGAFANKMHTKTNTRIIRKNVLFEPGDTLDLEKVMDNERIFRLLPYIKDVRFLVSEHATDTNLVELTVLTKDVFSFGIGARFNGVESGNINMYNQNIWGAGHQISANIIGHIHEEPYIGFEGYYTINNIHGDFLNLTLGYANSYRREGFLFNFDRQFLRTSTRWGGGLLACHFYETDRLYQHYPVITDTPLNYKSVDWWSGYAFQLKKGQPAKNKQLVFSGRVRYLEFFGRPGPGDDGTQFFANSNLYMAGMSLSKRNYIRDHHIYGYGITEDIPKGFLHELVVGFDDHEFHNRWYAHLYLSSGNFIRYKPSYLFASAAIGSFFNARRQEQGQLEFNLNYISRFFPFFGQNARQFIRLKYLYGINRFEQEDLFLKNDYGIRGFYSNVATGKQRLVLSLETVLFQKREILNFNFAFFGFTDLGIIGPSNQSVFTGDYYTGIGVGLRMRNESLVFKTLQLRLAFYPGHPTDVSAMGFGFTELGRHSFYSFQPRKPEPLQFY